jgi:hypothetical protein
MARLEYKNQSIMKTLHPEDYYNDQGKIVFTAAYHLKRGYCCGNNCLHCPYLKPPVKGTTTLEDDRRNPEGTQDRGETTVFPS